MTCLRKYIEVSLVVVVVVVVVVNLLFTQLPSIFTSRLPPS
jgi:hypothetical protein